MKAWRTKNHPIWDQMFWESINVVKQTDIWALNMLWPERNKLGNRMKSMTMFIKDFNPY